MVRRQWRGGGAEEEGGGGGGGRLRPTPGSSRGRGGHRASQPRLGVREDAHRVLAVVEQDRIVVDDVDVVVVVVVVVAAAIAW